MGDLIKQMPANFKTGLMVYGHHRKGDCKDIEMMVPIGLHNAAAMENKLKAIIPKGMPPLTDAVRQAAQALRSTEQRATVILVSDGLETCDKGSVCPCLEPAMSGVDFTVHAVGFNISKEDQGRLRCLADRTGGFFLTADDAGSLRKALFKTVEEVKGPPPPVVQDPGKAELKAPASVAAGATFSVQWKGPNSRGDYITIAKKGSKNLEYTDYVYTKRANPANFTTPGKTGDYELRYIHAQSKKVIGRNIMYSYTRTGNLVKMQVPKEPGMDEVLYILGGKHPSGMNFDSDINYMYPKGTSYGAPVVKFFACLDFE
jgi:Ca-activated chloride channel family protein